MTFRRLIALAVAAWLALASIPGLDPGTARASQGSGCMPTSGVVSGLTFAQDVNAAIAALISSNSGSSVPVTDCSTATIQGQIWLDTTNSQYKAIKFYDGANSLILGWLDITNHLMTSPIGGGSVSSTIASASTVDLGSVNQAYVTVTGSTGPITSFGSSAQVGTEHTIIFASTPTVTYNATSMILPGTATLTVAAGDVWKAVYLGGGNWRVISINAASGSPLVPVPTGTVLQWVGFTLPTGFIYANGQSLNPVGTYANLDATINVNESGSMVSTSNVITGLASTANLGVGYGACAASGIPANATITSIDSASQIHISANATATQTISIRFAPNGCVGGGSPSFNAPNYNGRLIAGIDGIGGSSLTNLMSDCTASTVMSGACGAQTKTIAQANLPNFSPTFTGNAVTPTFTGNAVTPVFTGTQQTWSTNQTNIGQGNAGGVTAGGGGDLVSNFSTATVTITPAGTIGAVTPSGTIGAITPSGTISALGSGTPIDVLNPIRMVAVIIKY
jgi:hypothetical protein